LVFLSGPLAAAQYTAALLWFATVGREQQFGRAGLSSLLDSRVLEAEAPA